MTGDRSAPAGGCCTPGRSRRAAAPVPRRSRSGPTPGAAPGPDAARRLLARAGDTERRRCEALATRVPIAAGGFLMGTDNPDGFPADGEGPVREVTVSPFLCDAFCVNGYRFARFVAATGYVTEAELFGWSFVFHAHVPEAVADRYEVREVPGVAWCAGCRAPAGRSRRDPAVRWMGGWTNRSRTSPGTTRWPCAVRRGTPAHRGGVGAGRARRAGAGGLLLGRRARARRRAPLQHMAGNVSRSRHGRRRVRRAGAGRRVRAQRIGSAQRRRQRLGVVRGLVRHRPRGGPRRPARIAPRARQGDEGRLVPVPPFVLQPLSGGRAHRQHAGQLHGQLRRAAGVPADSQEASS